MIPLLQIEKMATHWNSHFKVKPKVTKARKPIKRRSTLVGLKPKPTKTSLPTWIKAIPESQAHGSGTLQKRLWRLKSDFVRIRDWYAYDGRCVASGRKLAHWTLGQAGHFKPYSNCNGMFKFHEMNIHLQSANKNKWGNRDDWKAYENELILRYSQEFIDAIELSNKNWPLKITNEMVIQEIQRTIKMLGMCPEQPVYYPRVVALQRELEQLH